jgi:N-acetylglutamate synthase-like GNAT family acetyltransferase
MTITLRPATAADQPAITALIKTVDINPMDLKWPNFLVAVDEATQAIVATGQIKRHGDGSDELASIGTLPEYRGRGLAHQIITQLIAQHPATLYLTCLDYMAALYEEFGFRTIPAQEMPPYFRRLARLARMMGWLDKRGQQLLVMKREGTA